MKYCIEYSCVNDHMRRTIKRDSAHEAFIDAITVLDIDSYCNIKLWIEQ